MPPDSLSLCLKMQKSLNKIIIPTSVFLNWLICWMVYIASLKTIGGSLGYQSHILWPLEAPKIIIKNIPNVFSSPWAYWSGNLWELFIGLLVIVSLLGGLPGGITFMVASWIKKSKQYLFLANLLLGYYFICSYFVLLAARGE